MQSKDVPGVEDPNSGKPAGFFLDQSIEAESVVQAILDDIVKKGTDILYSNYLLFAAVDRAAMAHDGEPGTDDASFLDG